MVIVALFGDRFRTRIFRPELEMRLLGSKGEKARVILSSIDPKTGEQRSRQEDARYYHVSVSNVSRGRWPAATLVQVYLLRVEEPVADGDSVWCGAAKCPSAGVTKRYIRSPGR